MKKNKVRGRRVLALLLIAVLLITAVPILPGMQIEAAAATAPTLEQYATKAELMVKYDANDSTAMQPHKVYFGGSGLEWWITGSDRMCSGRDYYNNNLLLLSASTMGQSQFVTSIQPTIPFDNTLPSSYNEGNPSKVYSNHYGCSALRKALKKLESDGRFNTVEKTFMLNTTVYTYDPYNRGIYSTSDIFHVAYGDITSQNQRYVVLGSNEGGIQAYLMNGLKVSVNTDYYGMNYSYLRTPQDNSGAIGIVAPQAKLVSQITATDNLDIRPAFRLNLTSVLFASAAPTGQEGKLTANPGNTFTLRLSDSGKLSTATATVSKSESCVQVNNVPTNKQVYLVAQNSDGMWAKKVSGNNMVFASELDNNLASFENCKVWLETTESRMTYAKEATRSTQDNSFGVKINPGENMTVSSGNVLQSGISGTIAPITLQAAAGYCFPEDYNKDGTLDKNGIKVTRVNANQIRVSGTPTTDTMISLTATVKQIIALNVENLEFSSLTEGYSQPDGKNLIITRDTESGSNFDAEISNVTLSGGDDSAFDVTKSGTQWTVRPKEGLIANSDGTAKTYRETVSVYYNATTPIVSPATATVQFTVNPIISNVTVAGGRTSQNQYAKGSIVTIKANDPASGYEFDHWNVTDNIVDLENPNVEETKFTMPGTEVAVQAIYKDIEAPSLNIKVSTEVINKDLTTLSFERFFKGSKIFTITASDNDPAFGAGEIKFYLSDKVLSKDELGTMEKEKWLSYENNINITSNCKKVIYAKVSDAAGHTTIVNSEGVIIYSDAQTDTESISYIKTSTEDVTAGVTLNGNTIAGIKNGDYNLQKTEDYTISGGIITFKASYLDTLTAADYTLTVSYNPQGESYMEKDGNEAPLTTTIALTVDKAIQTALAVDISSNDVIYGENITTSTSGGSGTGAVTYSSSNTGVASVDERSGEVTIHKVGFFQITAVKAADGNYKETSFTSQEVTVRQKQISITGVTGANRDYDGTAQVALTGGELTGVIGNDEVGFILPAKENNTMTDKIAGQGKSVTIGTVNLTGREKGNYSLIQPTGITVNIVPKEVTITEVTVEDKEYDGTQSAIIHSEGVISGMIFGDDLKIKKGNCTFESADTNDNRKVTAEGFSLEGEDVKNYTLKGQPDVSNAKIIIAKNIFVKELVLTNWGYGGVPNKPDAEAKFGEVQYTYSKQETGAYTDDVPTTAGIYYVKASVEKTDNYTGLEAVRSFKIQKSQEMKPDITIDYRKEMLVGFESGMSYTVNQEAVMPEDGKAALAEAYFGTEISIVKMTSDTNNVSDSEPQILEIPKRADEPKVQGCSETVEGKNDGRITGTTEEMEYRSVRSSQWTECTDEEVVNLADGDYEVRMKATETTFAGVSALVTIAPGAEIFYQVTTMVNLKAGGTVTGTNRYKKDLDVVLYASAKKGYVFVSWTENGKELGTSTTLKIRQLAGNRTIAANFMKLPAKIKKLKVVRSGKGFILRWKKATGADGYQLQFVKTGQKSWKNMKKIKKLSKTKWRTPAMKNGRTYRFRIRAYKLVNTKKIYGSWVKTKKIRK